MDNFYTFLFSRLNLKYCCIYFFIATSAIAQVQFEQVLPPPPAPQLIPVFDGVYNSSVAFADVDGDNDDDVLITGNISSSEFISKLYINNGNGQYTEATGMPFDNVRLGSVTFADVDNDNDQDVLITGFTDSFQYISKLYRNDGTGNFTEVIGTPFDGVWLSSVAFADVDNNGTQDVLITGLNSSNTFISKLYVNNGNGVFSNTSTSFEGVRSGSVAFADVDGNGTSDVLITGQNSSAQKVSKLYINDGTGSFTEVLNTSIEGVIASSIAFADIDANGSQDLLVTGQDDNNQSISKLYTNDGSGNFTEVLNSPFEDVRNSSIAFADVDGNGTLDVLITGESSSAGGISKLYLNNGSGVFTEVIGTTFLGVRDSNVAFADVDGNGTKDVLITGRSNTGPIISSLYINDGSGNFKEITGSALEGVDDGAIAFADVDGDNDQDVLVTGYNRNNQPISELYINDGSGNFTEDLNAGFEPIGFSSIAFIDVDGNSTQDVLITGQDRSFQAVTKLYTNDGTGSFTEVISTTFEGVRQGSVAFADIDGNGTQDVLITGRNSSNLPTSKLYTNDGSGSFTEVLSTPFEEVNDSSIAFADVDGNSTQDVLITGQDNSFQAVTKLYTNDGTGSFTEVLNTPFDDVRFSSIAFADVDGNATQDVLITGYNGAFQYVSKLYTNDGTGNFAEVNGTPFDGVDSGSIAFADVDGNGTQDVLITGNDSSLQGVSKLYTNDGSASFTEVTGLAFIGVKNSSIAFTDTDGDGDPDVLITGRRFGGTLISNVYRNIPLDLRWTGSLNTNWDEAQNWVGGSIPLVENNVVIPDMVNQPVINSSQTVEINRLRLEENAEVDIFGIIKVNREIINNGHITFKSNASSTGQLDEFTGTISGTGDITVEHFIPAGDNLRRAFRFLTSSVNTTASINANWQEGATTEDINPNPNPGFGTHITGGSAIDGFDQSGTNNPSMFTFNNAFLADQPGETQQNAWSPLPNTNFLGLEAGKPYLTFIRGDRSIDVTSNGSTPTNTTLRATGLMAIGSHTSQILSDQDAFYSLIGNPYQAIVDFNQISFSGDVNENNMYVWNPNLNTRGGYETVTNPTQQMIQPGQSFFVQNSTTVSTPPTIEFSEAAKKTDGLVTTVFNDDQIARANLSLYNSEGLKLDVLQLGFEENANNGLDDFDGGKLSNPDETLSSVSNNTLLSVERRAIPQDDETIPLSVTQYQFTNYEFRLNIENWNTDIAVFVEDNYLDTTTPIDAQTPFSFSVDSGIPESVADNRFKLVFNNATLSLDENNLGLGISLYPNPVANHHFKISGLTLEQATDIKIYDMLGRLVYKKAMEATNEVEVNLNASLQNGVYQVTIAQGDNNYNTKLIIED